MSEIKKTMQEKIYDKFAELKNEANKDCKFDKSDLVSSFNNSMLLIKWITKKTEWSRVFRDLESTRKKAYRQRYEFYQTEFPLKLSTKEEYTLFIESDEYYSEHMNTSLVVKEIIQFIDQTIDTLKSRGFEIKNYIEWSKFINGN